MQVYDAWSAAQGETSSRPICANAAPQVDLSFVPWLQTCEEEVRQALYQAIDDRAARPDLITHVFEACNAPVPPDLFCG